MNRLLIAGTNSGCGKTTVTCAVLSALKARNLTPVAFKCGPDYLDPMFHRTAAEIAAYNLDPFFLDGDGLRSHLMTHARDISVIEGAMGYYDGIANTDEASAYSVAKQTETPVVLVVSAKGAGNSLTALMSGFAHYRPDSMIKGVVFNDGSDRRWPDLERFAKDAGLRAFGYLPRQDRWSMPSRHLGLYRTDEIANLQNVLSDLGRQAEQTIDMDGLLALSQTAMTISATIQTRVKQDVDMRVAVARDEAFCFHYEENLELLRNLGCELVYFSPLRDETIPAGANGLYLCGGYPELHAKKLSENDSMRKSIRVAVESGMPTVAEGGGFLYLHKQMGKVPMCGVIDADAFETNKLQRFGYITITANRENLLCSAGESIRSHEFHYWESSDIGNAFEAAKAGRNIQYPCVHATDALFAGFPHLYFLANPSFAERFVERMRHYESR